MKIEVIEIDKIKPYLNNPRQNDSGIKYLIESIKKFGFCVPIVVDKDMTIITGHTRYKAVKQMIGTLNQHIAGLTDRVLIENLTNINEGKIYGIVANDLTPEQTQEFRITDNKVFEHTKWDRDSLKFELRELKDIIGFSESEMSNLVSSVSMPYEKYTAENVSDKEKELNNKYEDKSKENAGNYIDEKCPFCEKTFTLNKKELLNSKYV